MQKEGGNKKIEKEVKEGKKEGCSAWWQLGFISQAKDLSQTSFLRVIRISDKITWLTNLLIGRHQRETGAPPAHWQSQRRMIGTSLTPGIKCTQALPIIEILIAVAGESEKGERFVLLKESDARRGKERGRDRGGDGWREGGQGIGGAGIVSVWW